jgi:hypothetical protein
MQSRGQQLADEDGDIACTIVHAPTLRIMSPPPGYVNHGDGAIDLESAGRHVAGLHTLFSVTIAA